MKILSLFGQQRGWGEKSRRRARGRTASHARRTKDRRLRVESLEDRRLLAVTLDFPDNGNAVAVDSAGYIYAAGNFRNDVDFDPGPGQTWLSGGGNYLAKYGPGETLVWVKQLGGLGTLDLAVDEADNLYFAGHFGGTVAFEGLPSLSTANLAAFIAKMDSAGHWLWAKKFGDSPEGDPAVLARADHLALVTETDGSRSIYVNGRFQGGVGDFDPAPDVAWPLTAQGSDVHVTKFSADGDLLWATNLRSSQDIWMTHMAADATGVYTCGHFRGSILSAGMTDTTTSYADGFVIKHDFAGNLLSRSLQFADYEVYAVGANGTSIYVSANKAAGAAGDFFAKYTPDLQVLQDWPLARGIRSNDILMNGDSLYVTGTLSAPFDFDLDPATSPQVVAPPGSEAAFVWKMTADHAGFVWAKAMGPTGRAGWGANSTTGNSIAVDGAGNVVTTGHFSSGGPADFDPGPGQDILQTGLDYDAFVSELNAAGDSQFAFQLGAYVGFIDDGGAGYSETGRGWKDGSNSRSWAGYRCHSRGTGTSTAQWRFDGLPAGTYDVYASWVGGAKNATDARYTVRTNAGDTAVPLMNQRVPPDDLERNSVYFEQLASALSASGTLSVILSDKANGNVIADAVIVVVHRPAPSGAASPLAAASLLAGEAANTIDGTVRWDLDADGTGDTPAGGVTVYLDQDRDGLADDQEQQAITDDAGHYGFTGLPDGTYYVAEAVPAGAAQTAPATSTAMGLAGEATLDFPALGDRGIEWVDGYLCQVRRYDTNLYRTNALTGEVAPPLKVPSGHIIDLAWDGALFWGADFDDSQLVQFNSQGTVLKSLPAPATSPRGIAWDGSRLWVAAAGRIYRVDPATGAQESSFAAPAGSVNGLTSDGLHVWAARPGTIYEMDASGTVLRSFPAPYAVDYQAYGIAFDTQTESLWISQVNDGRLMQVDPGVAASHEVAVPGTTGPVDFGIFQLGSISGQAYDDLDGDAARDAEEPGLGGWQVYLDQNANGLHEAWEKSAITDDNGFYTITGLRPGTYSVTEVLRRPGTIAPRSVTVNQSGQAIVGIDLANRADGMGPAGTETRVNGTAAGAQQTSTVQSVAMDSAGNSVVVWEGNGPGDADGIFARRYDAAGNPVGGEFRVNTTTTGLQRQSLVAMASQAGTFVVAWYSNGSIHGQRFDASGKAAGREFVVAGGKGTTRPASIAMDARGGFAVLYYQVANQTSTAYPYWYVQRYDPAGKSVGGAIKVAQPGLIDGVGSLAMDADGDFVVVWEDSGVNVQRYRASGQKAGSPVKIEAPALSAPNVAMDGAGNFLVSWAKAGHLGAGQLFNADGTLRGPQFAYGYCISGQRTAIAMQADGSRFALAWELHPSNGTADVYAQRFRVTDTGVVSIDSGPFLVPATLAGDQGTPSIAVDGTGNIAVVWSGSGIGDDSGVFVQRDTATTAGTLAVGSVASAAAATDAAMLVLLDETNHVPFVRSLSNVLPSGSKPAGTRTAARRFVGVPAETALADIDLYGLKTELVLIDLESSARQ